VSGKGHSPKFVCSSYVITDHDRANLKGHHHCLSSAERANDALLITEVKNALADDGVAHDVAIVVDCDHGKILLSGVMKFARTPSTRVISQPALRV